MMRQILGMCLLASALLATGCAAFYTGIHKDGPDTYTLTRINQGFWRISGSVYHCKATGSSMSCTEIDEE